MTPKSTPPHLASPASTSLHVAVWAVQLLLALTFIGTGIWKLTTPIADLASTMPWMGQVTPAFLYATATLDLLGGLGLLLPSVTRIKPGLAVLAAVGCVALMLGAAVFHVLRGEVANTPFNFVMAALAGFVAWARSASVRIERRG